MFILKFMDLIKISNSLSPLNLNKVSDLLGIERAFIQRPVGEIDILIGFEHAGFHPTAIRNVEHLVLMKSRFGYCLGGTHPLLHETGEKLIQDISIHYLKGETLDDFFNTESLGTQCIPKCGSCKCGECPVGSQNYSIKEENELKLIDKGLKFENNQWEASYPWLKDPGTLPNNRSVALARLVSTEKRLRKRPEVSELYSQQIQDMIENGVARKLSVAEIRNYAGPIHYVAHHEILKQSQTTPCRIVFNTSAKFLNVALNDYWATGPNLMNNLLGVLLRFCENYFAIVGDIKRMYHTIRISQLDQHVHRFLWRELKCE